MKPDATIITSEANVVVGYAVDAMQHARLRATILAGDPSGKIVAQCPAGCPDFEQTIYADRLVGAITHSLSDSAAQLTELKVFCPRHCAAVVELAVDDVFEALGSWHTTAAAAATPAVVKLRPNMAVAFPRGATAGDKQMTLRERTSLFGYLKTVIGRPLTMAEAAAIEAAVAQGHRALGSLVVALNATSPDLAADLARHTHPHASALT